MDTGLDFFTDFFALGHVACSLGCCIVVRKGRVRASVMFDIVQPPAAATATRLCGSVRRGA
jgi:hypothetical protein